MSTAGSSSGFFPPIPLWTQVKGPQAKTEWMNFLGQHATTHQTLQTDVQNLLPVLTTYQGRQVIQQSWATTTTFGAGSSYDTIYYFDVTIPSNGIISGSYALWFSNCTGTPGWNVHVKDSSGNSLSSFSYILQRFAAASSSSDNFGTTIPFAFQYPSGLTGSITIEAYSSGTQWNATGKVTAVIF